MSAPDTMMPLLTAPWPGRFGEQLPTFPLPGLRREAIANLESHWTGTMTPEIRQLLQSSCGSRKLPSAVSTLRVGGYPEEPLSVFRPSLTLAIDDQGRRWIADVGKRRGLPGPVWCVFPKPEVAMVIDRTLAEFVVRLHSNERRDGMLQWLTVLNVRAHKIRASRHARAIALPAAFIGAT